jgi:histidinol phosphatase-like enzyme (inositol monophosphatase family)
MNVEALRELCVFAVDVAWRAGRTTLGHFQTGVAVEAKEDASPVTIADREAERAARRMIERRFPRDGILGEEYGSVRPDAPRRWIIDPIDGTRSFVRGVPLYGVRIALEVANRSVLGVIHLPALQETIYAARGIGCWWNGRRARVSDVARIEDAMLLTSDVASVLSEGRGAAWDRLLASGATTRTWGDCYGYALVATGRAEAMFDPVLSVWDAAALPPIIEEAGGVITDWNGEDSYGNGHLVATNAALAVEIRARMRDGGGA